MSYYETKYAQLVKYYKNCKPLLLKSVKNLAINFNCTFWYTFPPIQSETCFLKHLMENIYTFCLFTNITVFIFH